MNKSKWIAATKSWIKSKCLKGKWMVLKKKENNVVAELPHMEDLMKLCDNPSVEGAKAYFEKWGGTTYGDDDDDEAILAGIHKARITLGIKVEESTEWLTSRDYLANPL